MLSNLKSTGKDRHLEFAFSDISAKNINSSIVKFNNFH